MTPPADDAAALPESAAVRVEGVRKVYDAPPAGRDVPADGDLDDDVTEDDIEDEDPDVPAPTPGAALDGVSFTVPRGTWFGIAGPSGAGKTTLVRLLSRTLAPTAGRIWVRGRVAPAPQALVRLFERESTGRRNVRLLAHLLGFEGRRAEDAAGDIFAFAGLPGRQDARLRTFAAGELTALAVSTVLHLDPDLLLFDPWPKLADAELRTRVDEAVAARVRGGATVVITGLDAEGVAGRTDAYVVLEAGRLTAQSPGRRGEEAAAPAVPAPGSARSRPRTVHQERTEGVAVAGVGVEPPAAPGTPLAITVDVEAEPPGLHLVCGLILRRAGAVVVKTASSELAVAPGRSRLRAEIEAASLSGVYDLEIALLVRDGDEQRAVMWTRPGAVRLGGERVVGASRTAWTLEGGASEVGEGLGLGAHEEDQARQQGGD